MWQHQDPNYLQRLTPLFFMILMADTFPADVVKAHFLPVLRTLSRDRVANVRMNVAKSASALGAGLKTQQPSQQTAETIAQLKLILQEIKNDDDTDVKYFTQKAIAAI